MAHAALIEKLAIMAMMLILTNLSGAYPIDTTLTTTLEPRAGDAHFTTTRTITRTITFYTTITRTITNTSWSATPRPYISTDTVRSYNYYDQIPLRDTVARPDADDLISRKSNGTAFTPIATSSVPSATLSLAYKARRQEDADYDNLWTTRDGETTPVRLVATTHTITLLPTSTASKTGQPTTEVSDNDCTNTAEMSQPSETTSAVDSTATDDSTMESQNTFPKKYIAAIVVPIVILATMAFIYCLFWAAFHEEVWPEFPQWWVDHCALPSSASSDSESFGPD